MSISFSLDNRSNVITGCGMVELDDAVLSYRQLRRCNSTTLLTSSHSSVYALGFVLASRHLDPDSYYSSNDDDVWSDYWAIPGSVPAPFTAACPAQFSALPGQRLRVALYSFGARLPDDDSTTGPDRPEQGHLPPKAFVGAPPAVIELPPSSCPVSVNVREARDAAPQHDNDICRPQRHRQRHLYTTNGTSVELFITGIDVDDEHRRVPPVEFHRWNFILKLEGKLDRQFYASKLRT